MIQKKIAPKEYYNLKTNQRDDHGTSSVVIIDQSNNAVSCSGSLNRMYRLTTVR